MDELVIFPLQSPVGFTWLDKTGVNALSVQVQSQEEGLLFAALGNSSFKCEGYIRLSDSPLGGIAE